MCHPRRLPFSAKLPFLLCDNVAAAKLHEERCIDMVYCRLRRERYLQNPATFNANPAFTWPTAEGKTKLQTRSLAQSHTVNVVVYLVSAACDRVRLTAVCPWNASRGSLFAKIRFPFWRLASCTWNRWLPAYVLNKQWLSCAKPPRSEKHIAKMLALHCAEFRVCQATVHEDIKKDTGNTYSRVQHPQASHIISLPRWKN